MTTKFDARLESLVGRREVVRAPGQPAVPTVIDLYRNLHVGDRIIRDTTTEAGTISGYTEVEIITSIDEQWLTDEANLFIEGRNVSTGETVTIPFGFSGICSKKTIA